MKDKLVTIVTPTYNRARTLINCYKSLREQTSKNFLWMIIDDGSTDDTQEKVSEWILEDVIKIQYKRKENGGKVSALNFSLEFCITELWVCLDSDDIFVNNAIEIIELKYLDIKNQDNVAGLLSLRVNKFGDVIGGKRIPIDRQYSKILDLKYFDKINSETVLVFKSKIIKKYPYPIIEGEKFFPLGYIFYQIDEEYIFYVVQNTLMIGEYLGDGISSNKNSLIIKNPKGYVIAKKQSIKRAPNLYWKTRETITYISGNFLIKNMKLHNIIQDSPARLLTIVLFPFGYFYYIYRFKNKVANVIMDKSLLKRNGF